MTSGKIVTTLLEQGDVDNPHTFLKHYESPLKLLIIDWAEGEVIRIVEDTPKNREAVASFQAAYTLWAENFNDNNIPQLEPFLKERGVDLLQAETVYVRQ